MKTIKLDFSEFSRKAKDVVAIQIPCPYCGEITKAVDDPAIWAECCSNGEIYTRCLHCDKPFVAKII